MRDSMRKLYDDRYRNVDGKWIVDRVVWLVAMVIAGRLGVCASDRVPKRNRVAGMRRPHVTYNDVGISDRLLVLHHSILIDFAIPMLRDTLKNAMQGLVPEAFRLRAWRAAGRRRVQLRSKRMRSHAGRAA